MDDLTIFIVDLKVVHGINSQLEREFCKEGPPSIHRGNVHVDIGICLDFRCPGKLVDSMESYQSHD
jgi:hypothetical protein